MTINTVGAASGTQYDQSASAARTPPALTNTAQLLGLSTTQLSTAMQSGTTLSALAQQSGVSSSALLSSVEQDLQANAPQGANVSASRVQQFATNLINGSGGMHHGHHHHHGGGAAGATSSTDSTEATDLAQLLDPTSASSTSTSATDSLSTLLNALTGDSSSSTAASNLSSLASATGMSPTDLLSQLTSGQDLSALLGSAGPTGYGSTIASSVSGGVAVDQYA